MKKTLRILLVLLAAALVVAMAGCKGESSPTAPPSTSTVPPGGTITPPSGASIVLTVSNATPLVSSRVTVTATVTSNGSPVPDGTAVQFVSSAGGTFTDTGQTSTIRTTTNGVATATLTSATAGTITVTATVNNVSKSTTVTFSVQQQPPQGPSTTPTISSVCVVTGTTCTTPATGIPAGGQTVIINGTNFRAPVLVLFDPGNGQPAKPAFVNSVTATQISVTAPPFDIITGQTLPVTITVIDEVGTQNEQKVSAPAAFTYQLAVLTPVIRTLTPTSGPIDGGTRVSILGDAFQAPVQVFFGAAEAQVVSVKFDEIVVMSPTARDTNPNASGTVTGPVDILVRNVASGKQVTFPAGFRYVAKMQITAAGPTIGTTAGGTRVLIDGVGFNDPVVVTVAGVPAQVIKVTGTEVTVVTTPPLLTSCANVTGPIVVTNVDNGDSATGPTFVFQILKPQIVAVGTGTVGGTSTVTIANALGTPRITVGSAVAFITGTTVNSNGTTTYTFQLPPSLILSTQPCNGSTTAVPTAFDVTYTSIETTCTDTAPKSLVVNPASGAILTVVGAFSPFTGHTGDPTATPPVPPSSSPANETVSFVNTGNTTNLTVSSVTTGAPTSGRGCAAFQVSSTPPTPAVLAQCDKLDINTSYVPAAAPTSTPDQCTITVMGTVGSTPFTKQFTVSGTTAP